MNQDTQAQPILRPTQNAQAEPSGSPNLKARAEHRLLRKRYQNKRYILKGYTTASRVERKYSKAKQRRFFSQAVTIVIIAASLIALWIWLKPISLISEIMKTIGYH